MKILYVLYTYNRPNILKECIRTLFNPKNTVWPSEMIIVDDGSADFQMKDSLYTFSRDNSSNFPIHFFNFMSNQGLGWNWQMIWDWVKMHGDYDYVCQLEQDYVWREDAIGVAIAVMEEKPLSLALSLMSNPDYWNGKQNTLFPEVMIMDFGEDPAKREYLHKPYNIETENYGRVLIQGTTNSCGTFICNWQRIKRLLDKYPDMWEKTFERAFNKPYPERRKYAGDGPLTSGLSYFWYKDVEDRINKGENIDYSVEAPWLDVADFSLSSHVNGGPSLNGFIVPEMDQFIFCPNWKNEYLVKNPRNLA